jgi:APA family basic amino acid/polyamine antiporter
LLVADIHPEGQDRSLAPFDARSTLGEDIVSSDTVNTTTAEPELKRALGPWLLLLFIVGDILGTGIYALTGQVAAEVGGAAWLPFIVAFAVAAVTATSYLELVTKFPKAAGAALYVHKAFNIHFVSFLVCFVVMSSGISSASAASQAFAANLAAGFGLDIGRVGILGIALGFMLLILAINFRGVTESVRLNVFLTLVELSGLLLVILIGFWAIFGGNADFSRVIAFETPEDKNVLLAVSAATSLAFFAMVGFEDSVNMAEETKDPSRIFPRMMFTGLGFAAVIYVLVSICAVAIVPIGELAGNETPLVTVVQTAAPDFPISDLLPFISMFAVANSALINMMMASRLLYGMSRQGVLPRFLGKVHPERRTPWAAIIFTTAIALCLITYVSLDPEGSVVAVLGGTTSLLLLAVFAVVNVTVLVLRRQPVEHKHFRAWTALPIIGAIACLYLVIPGTSGRAFVQYETAGLLVIIGIVLWAVTWVAQGRERRERAAQLGEPPSKNSSGG